MGSGSQPGSQAPTRAQDRSDSCLWMDGLSDTQNSPLRKRQTRFPVLIIRTLFFPDRSWGDVCEGTLGDTRSPVLAFLHFFIRWGVSGTKRPVTHCQSSTLSPEHRGGRGAGWCPLRDRGVSRASPHLCEERAAPRCGLGRKSGAWLRVRMRPPSLSALQSRVRPD